MFGGGYNCKEWIIFKRSTDVIWNKVTHHLAWIKETAKELGETLACGPPKEIKEKPGGDVIDWANSVVPHVEYTYTDELEPSYEEADYDYTESDYDYTDEDHFD